MVMRGLWASPGAEKLCCAEVWDLAGDHAGCPLNYSQQHLRLRVKRADPRQTDLHIDPSAAYLSSALAQVYKEQRDTTPT